MTGALDGDQLAADELGESGAVGQRADGVLVTMDHQDRSRVARSAARSGSENGSPWALDPSRVAISVSGSVSSPQPTVSSIGLVECGSVNICEKKNSRNSR